MKCLYYGSIILLLLSSAMFAQNPIPNSGFEDWSGGEPDEWISSNIPGVLTNVTQSSDSHSGASSVQGAVVSFGGSPIVPSIFSGTLTDPYFPISVNYASLTGFYMLGREVDEIIVLTVDIRDANDNILAVAIEDIAAPAFSFTPFTIPLQYIASGNAAKARISAIMLTSSGGLPILGTNFHLDDLEFTGVVAIDPLPGVPDEFTLKQNYPNPFNPETTIEFSLLQTADVTLTIYNALGQQMARLVDERLAPGNYETRWNALDYAGGSYFYRLQAGEFVQTRRLVLLK